MPFSVGDALPWPNAYGKIAGGDQDHADRLDYSFEGTPGDVTIVFQAWDVDLPDEIEILINGCHVGCVPLVVEECDDDDDEEDRDSDCESSGNNKWSSTHWVTLPDAHVDDAGINVLTFSNRFNPPRSYWWGVGNVRMWRRCSAESNACCRPRR